MITIPYTNNPKSCRHPVQFPRSDLNHPKNGYVSTKLKLLVVTLVLMTEDFASSMSLREQNHVSRRSRATCLKRMRTNRVSNLWCSCSTDNSGVQRRARSRSCWRFIGRSRRAPAKDESCIIRNAQRLRTMQVTLIWLVNIEPCLACWYLLTPSLAIQGCCKLIAKGDGSAVEISDCTTVDVALTIRQCLTALESQGNHK